MNKIKQINIWAYILAFFEALTKLPKALERRILEKSKWKLEDREIFKAIEENKWEIKKGARVGIVSTWYRKGVPYQSRFLTKCLSQNNHVYLFAYKGITPDERDWQYTKLTYTNKISGWKVINWAKLERPKIIFFPDRLEDKRVLEWCAKNNIATVLIINYETVSKSDFDHYLKFTKLLCPVRCTYDLLSDYGIPNIHHIQWGIDTSIYSSSKSEIKPPIRFIHNAGYGGADWRKNTEAVLKAFKIASEKNKDIELVFKSQRPLREYPKIVQKLAKDPQVIVIDKDLELNELLKLYQSCHVSLLPSKWEGIGLPFLESLSMGIPVLTLDAPPMNEWIKNNYNGYCSKVIRWERRKDPNVLIMAALVDIDDYSNQILRFSDPKLIKETREGAIESVKDSEKIFTKKIDNFIKEVLL